MRKAASKVLNAYVAKLMDGHKMPKKKKKKAVRAIVKGIASAVQVTETWVDEEAKKVHALAQVDLKGFIESLEKCKKVNKKALKHAQEKAAEVFREFAK